MKMIPPPSSSMCLRTPVLCVSWASEGYVTTSETVSCVPFNFAANFLASFTERWRSRNNIDNADAYAGRRSVSDQNLVCVRAAMSNMRGVTQKATYVLSGSSGTFKPGTVGTP